MQFKYPLYPGRLMYVQFTSCVYGDDWLLRTKVFEGEWNCKEQRFFWMSFGSGRLWQRRYMRTFKTNPHRNNSIDFHYQTIDFFLNNWNIFHQYLKKYWSTERIYHKVSHGKIHKKTIFYLVSVFLFRTSCRNMRTISYS